MSVSRKGYFEKVAKRRELERKILRPRKPRPDMPPIAGTPPRSPLLGFSQRLLLLSHRSVTVSLREAAKRRLRVWILYTKIAGSRETRAWRIEPYSYRIRRLVYGGRYKVGVPRKVLFGYDSYGEGTIKMFARVNVHDVLITRSTFQPRWRVEIS